jgi:predicted amidohydrolase YtcJ
MTRGEPTGVLVDNAMHAVSVAIGTARYRERLETQIERGLHGPGAVGLTSGARCGHQRARVAGLPQSLQPRGACRSVRT